MFPEHLEGKEIFLPGCSALDADTRTEGAELLPQWALEQELFHCQWELIP